MGELVVSEFINVLIRMGSGASKPESSGTNAPKTVLNTVKNASKSALNTITGASKPATQNSANTSKSITVGSNSIPVAPAYNNKAVSPVSNNMKRNNTPRNNTPRNNTVRATRNNTRNNTRTNVPMANPAEYSQVPVIRANNQVHGPQGLTGGRRKARKSANRKSSGGSRRRR